MQVLDRSKNIFSRITLILLFINFSCCNSNIDKKNVVSAASPEAVEAGLEIFGKGGNAIDATIAIAFALAVSEPAQSGLGGQAQFLIYFPGQEPVLINGTSLSPSKLPANITKADLVNHKATTIPSLVKALNYLWKNYGSKNIEWKDLLKPAIEYAKTGFHLTEFRYKVLEYKEELLKGNAVTEKLFLGEDVLNVKKTLWKQPVLANTLKRLAEKGAEDFYTGKIAQLIIKDMEIHNGWIKIDDLNNFPEPKKQESIKGTYRGYQIYTMPPPGGGWVIIQALNILEQFPSTELTLNNKNRLKIIAQALQLAHQSRSEEPIKDLINYEKDVMQKTSKEEAENLLRGETTHFSVVDKNGIVVSATLSINNYFGSKSASPELGFLYNDYMNEFKVNKPGHPFNLRPNAMPYSSMTPTILMKDGKPVMAIGSPGSERIISAIVQVISLWIDAKLSLKEAVTYPRIHVTPDSVIYLESNTLLEEEISFLEKSGFKFDIPPSEIIINDLNPYFGGIHAIALENNQWSGVADPRRDGTVGYQIK